MKKTPMFAAMLGTAAHIRAFDNTEPAWKMDGDKFAVKDGNPLYVASDGTEMTIDLGTIARLNNEAKTHRTEKETLASKFKPFEGMDAQQAKQAIELMSKVDQKKLIDAGEVDKVRAEISQSFTAQMAEKDTAISTLQGRVNNMVLDGAFNSSAFVRDNIAIPPDVFRDSFGKFFKVENEKVVAIGRDGNPLYSKTRAGELANFDEAVSLLVDTHPAKDALLRTNTGGGTGNNGNGGGRNSARTMKRSDFDALQPAQQAHYAGLMGKGEIQIVD